ncbi:MAG: hypothetical protein LBB80_09895, partial [Treponema sp.]|jgi:hypothetical protein|nr:hypothetical protein [Treponema sp.]
MDNFLINTFEPQEGLWYCWNVNGALGYLKKERARWQTAFQDLPLKDMTDDFYGPREEAPPEALPRSVMVGPGTALALHPVLSEKPYLVTLQEKLCLVPAAEARFTVLFPPALAFETADNQRITAFTPFACSEAWFGDDTASGILCRSLPSHCIIWSSELVCTAPLSLIRCPLVIRNRAKTPLELDRLAIYTEPLNIYEHEGCLWSDTVALDSIIGGNIEMNVLPETPESYRKIRVAARNGMGDILIRQGADFIKNITSL